MLFFCAWAIFALGLFLLMYDAQTANSIINRVTDHYQSRHYQHANPEPSEKHPFVCCRCESATDRLFKFEDSFPDQNRYCQPCILLLHHHYHSLQLLEETITVEVETVIDASQGRLRMGTETSGWMLVGGPP